MQSRDTTYERTVQVRPGEVVFCEGDTIYIADSYADSEHYKTMPPVVRAVTVARLRAIADMIEGSDA